MEILSHIKILVENMCGTGFVRKGEMVAGSNGTVLRSLFDEKSKKNPACFFGGAGNNY